RKQRAGYGHIPIVLVRPSPTQSKGGDELPATLAVDDTGVRRTRLCQLRADTQPAGDRRRPGSVQEPRNPGVWPMDAVERGGRTRPRGGRPSTCPCRRLRAKTAQQPQATVSTERACPAIRGGHRCGFWSCDGVL